MSQVRDSDVWARMARDMNAVQADLKARFDEAGRRKRALIDALEAATEPGARTVGITWKALFFPLRTATAGASARPLALAAEHGGQERRPRSWRRRWL